MQFERAVREFARWRAVPKERQSAAPAWWWGPAFEVSGQPQPMPADWCARLELPVGATLADGAAVLLKSIAEPDLADLARRFSRPCATLGSENPA